jgi:hypothetical protein
MGEAKRKLPDVASARASIQPALVLNLEAWLIAHKLRHALSERAEFALSGLLEIDESYYGGRGKPASRGRSLADPNKSLMAIAVETVPASPRQGNGIKASRFVAGSARIAVLPSASAASLAGFVRSAAKPGTRIITDAFKSYDGLADGFRHYPIVQDGGKNADAVLPSSMSCSAT